MWREGGDIELHRWIAGAPPAPVTQVVIERLDLNSDEGWQVRGH